MLKKIFLILIPLVLIITALISYFNPDLNLWGLEKSLFLKNQKLNLPVMFLPKQKNGLIVSNPEPQFVLAGNKMTLFSGRYEYNLKITPSCEGEKIGYMDVVRGNGREGFGAKEIIALKKDEPQVEKVVFESENVAFDWEFRLYSYGQCPFEITGGSLIRQKSDFRGFLRQLKGLIKK